MFLFRVRKHLYVGGMFSPSFSERLSNGVAFLADSKMPRTTDLGIRLKMISIIISPLLFQHQPSNLKCLCIVIETTWVVITPNIWHFNVISPWGHMSPFIYMTGNGWVISLAFGLPNTGSDHIESKWSPIIRRSRTENSKPDTQTWKTISHNLN